MKRALLIVDLQNDFMPGGKLPVPLGNEIVAFIHPLLPTFDTVIATQDWHPEGHSSFSLWPVHCIAGTEGAELVKDLDKKQLSLILYKGKDPLCDSYSAFADAQGRTTGLGGYLRALEIEEVHVVGVATDICVFHTVQDALKEGFSVHLFKKGCAGLENTEAALTQMEALGVVLY